MIDRLDESPSLLDARGRGQLLATYRDGLLDDVLPFWLRHAVDREHGGVTTSVNRDGSLLDSDVGVWQQARFTWLLGELYNNVEPRGEWLEVARATSGFLERHGFDPADGRMWFHVARDGKPIRKRRYAFTESFAAIAFGEMAQATGREAYAALATACFKRFVEHGRNPPETTAKFTRTRPTRGIGVPMITINTAQQLRDSIGLASADEWIERSIEEIQRFHVKDEIECVMETVAMDGGLLDHFDGRTLNPGHAIEGAWFILWEGRNRNNTAWVQLGCKMLDWMWRRGWDQEYGGLLYYVDVHGLPVSEYWHDMKFWWPHNEAIVATLLAYLLTGDAKYAHWHREVHAWSYRHFPDPEHGEWFGYLHRDGRRSVPLKGNLWKGPFHLPRMQLTCWNLLSGWPDAWPRPCP